MKSFVLSIGSAFLGFLFFGAGCFFLIGALANGSTSWDMRLFDLVYYLICAWAATITFKEAQKNV